MPQLTLWPLVWGDGEVSLELGSEAVCRRVRLEGGANRGLLGLLASLLGSFCWTNTHITPELRGVKAKLWHTIRKNKERKKKKRITNTERMFHKYLHTRSLWILSKNIFHGAGKKNKKSRTQENKIGERQIQNRGLSWNKTPWTHFLNVPCESQHSTNQTYALDAHALHSLTSPLICEHISLLS